MSDKKIVVIGGGTGSFSILQALKYHTKDITALVTMADDGGSTGVLRDELGVLPPGDVRQCLVALSESSRVRDLFTYRFEEGTFNGHSFGNIFMAALEKMTGNFAEAVEEASRVLNIVGRVEPITLDKVRLVMEKSNGEITEGEFQIGHADFGGAVRPVMRLTPEPTLNPQAKEAILSADLVVIAPGNLYGSLAPALIVPGLSEVMNTSQAKKVYVCNLVTKPGQTDGFKVSDFADEIERFSGCKLDYVLYDNEKPNSDLLSKYAKENEFWVEVDTNIDDKSYQAIGGPFISASFTSSQASNTGDIIAATRTLIRHDSEEVAACLMKLN